MKTIALLKLIVEAEFTLPSALERVPELAFKRLVTVNAYYKSKRLPEGGRGCSRCGTAVKAPRKTWCSALCVSDTLIRCTPSFARDWVHFRDKGVCAVCNVKSKQWDADHIVPVIRGGGHTSLSNYRTLCKICHKACTKSLAGERAAEKQASRDEDQRRLDSGEVTREQLREENSAFGELARTATIIWPKNKLY